MKRLFAIALLFAGLAARAQETPTVTARVEPDSIMIGDRFDYVIDVEKDLVQVVEFPVFDPRDGKIELVENCPVDTLERDGRRLKLRKRYRLAAFDEGKYNLGAAQVLYADKNILDTLRSTDSVYLEVATFQIDSTSQSIYDLKAQKNLPFRFREVSGYVKWGVFFLLMLLAAGYALKRYLASRGKGFGDLFKPAPPLPPHVAAIQALEALHNQKLWQNNRHKQYYSGLTDILRTYIAARWGFGAMEMTSDEIIETMRPEELPDKARMDLTAILRDADLVKFAKATPEAEQNEAEAQAEAERLEKEKEEADAAIDKWYEDYYAALKAASTNSGGSYDSGIGYIGTGSFVWPMPGYTYITCYYGDGGHRGIDIAGGGIYGKPIVAADGGKVIYSDWMDSYGYCVFIDHGNGYSTRYAHASALACSVGDTVSPGQTIAYVGSTGNSTGPHLHFEVIYYGSTTNPFNYF